MGIILLTLYHIGLKAQRPFGERRRKSPGSGPVFMVEWKKRGIFTGAAFQLRFKEAV